MKLRTTHNLMRHAHGVYLPDGVHGHVNTRHPFPVRSLNNRQKYVAACESALARAAHSPPRRDPETTRVHATQISAKAPPRPPQPKRDSLRRCASSTRAWLLMLEASTLISFSTTQLSAPLPRAAKRSVEASSAVTVAAAELEPSAAEPSGMGAGKGPGAGTGTGTGAGVGAGALVLLSASRETILKIASSCCFELRSSSSACACRGGGGGTRFPMRGSKGLKATQ